KLAGNERVQKNSCSLIFGQHHFLLYHNQCSGTGFSHIETSLHNLVDCLICETCLYFFSSFKRNYRGDHIFLSQLLQDFSQFRLKDNHQRRHHHGSNIDDNPDQRIHHKQIDNHQETQTYHDTLEQGIRSSLFVPDHKLINENGDDQNFNNINNSDVR